MSNLLVDTQQIGTYTSGYVDVIGHVVCDTVADLPTYDAYQSDGVTLRMGSKAEIIADGSIYKLDSSGTWVLQPADAQIALDLSGYYTSAQVDSLLASYTNTSDMNTAINTAIMSTQYINRGTELPNTGADLDTITTPGKYFTSAYANMMTNLPSTFAGLAFVLVVDYTTTTTGTRCRQTLYPAAAPSNQPVPHFWQRYMTGASVWRAWVDFAGTIL